MMSPKAYRTALVLAVFTAASCGGEADVPQAAASADTAAVVLGPSLVELFFDAGIGWRIVGVDRFSDWPPEVTGLPDVGGYLDASFESIAALHPTSIHSVGHSPPLAHMAAELGVPYYSYSFDTLEDVFDSAERLEALYGVEAGMFREGLLAGLDSLREGLGGSSPSVLLVVYHQPGSGTMTVAGRGTFLADLVTALGCSLSAPDHGTYPSVSVEGVLDMAPERIVCLYPDVPDTLRTREGEAEFWSGFGYDGNSVHVLYQDYLLVPGSRLLLTAERIAECLP